MHCSHNAIWKVRKAAMTTVKVAQTSLRNVDLLGAMRKYETRMDNLTELDAKMKKFCPAIEAYPLLDDEMVVHVRDGKPFDHSATVESLHPRRGCSIRTAGLP